MVTTASALLALCACCGCGRLGFAEVQQGDATTAGDADDVADRCAADRPDLGTWSTPTPVAELNSVSSDEDPTPTADQLELFFVSTRDGLAGEIFRANRSTIGQPWGSPTRVLELSDPAGENTLELSEDALTMWFASGRTGGLGMDDIWVTTRPDRDSPWSAPSPVAELSSASTDRGAAVFDDGHAIIFHSDRPGGLGANDLYTATRASTADPWSPPTLLGSPNSADTEQHAWVSPCGLVLVFHTNRSGNTDLWETRRASATDPFDPPTAMTELNSSSTDKDLWMTRDRRRGYFASNRVGGNMNIYETSR